jgi:hypothetical protein
MPVIFQPTDSLGLQATVFPNYVIDHIIRLAVRSLRLYRQN